MADTVQQRIFSAEQVVVKSDFPKILLDYSKEVIRQNPQNVIAFSRHYFEQKLVETGFVQDDMKKLEANMKSLVFQKGEKIQKHYQIGNVIGDVTCSKARIATHKKTKQQKAVKIYDKTTIPDYQDYLKKVQLQAEIDHPNVLSYSEVYEDNDYLYLVSDYMQGGELYDAIVAKGNFSEHDAAFITRQLLQASAYLHSKGVVHRNLRPGNIMMKEAGKFDLKIIDFDFAGIKPAGEDFFLKMNGNPYYEAPEVIRNQYNEKCDIWSIGVLLYYMLSGSLPFDGYYNQQIVEKVLDGSFDLDSDIWFFVSEDVKDLIRQLLWYDVSGRPSAVEALKHPWFSNYQKGIYKSKDLSQALTNIYEFNAGTKLKQSVLAFFTKNLLTQQEMTELTAQFSEIDKNGNGTLSKDEILEAYRNIKGIDFNQEEVEALINNVDADGSGEIDYSEWLMTAVSKEKLLSKDKLEQAFSLFDKNGDKQISYEEVVALLDAVKHIDTNAVERAVKEIDNKGKGQLTFKEFKHLIETLFEG